MYIRIVNDHPEEYSIDQLKRDNPMVSFPSDISNDILAAYGVYPVKLTEPPMKNPKKDIVQLAPVFINGEWCQKWGQTTISSKEIKNRANKAVRDARRDAYLPMSEQLDMMYWDAINGTSNWVDHITSVKAAHPKIP